MPTPLEQRVQQALGPRILVEGEIASGGMGVVYRALDTGLGRRVAVKVLRPELWTARQAERFREEARTLAGFRHPHIVPIYEVPRPEDVDGLSLYVMAFLDGPTLADCLAQGRLPRDQVRVLGLQLLDALDEVHRRGVIHRDVKPSNVVYDALAGAWALADFGIARGSEHEPLTEPGTAVGTPAYMPDEQRRGRATARSDIYAAGATLYEAYTREPWGGAESLTGKAWRLIPARQARALRRALAPSPRDRWATAAEFREALRGAPAWTRRPVSTVLIALAALVILWVVLHPWSPAPPVELGLAPVRTDDPSLAAEAADLGHALRENLTTLGLAASPVASCDQPATPPHCVVGRLTRISGDRLGLALVVGRQQGERQTASFSGSTADMSLLAGWATYAVLQRTGYQTLVNECHLDSVPPANHVSACGEYRRGVIGFRADDWTTAVYHFRRAIELNPLLADALWRLYTAQVWRRDAGAASVVDLLRDHRSDLAEVHRALFDAQQARQGAERNRRFEELVRRYPLDAFPLLLYGSELFHRGALVGIPLDSSAAVLRQAVAADSGLAEAFDQLLWTLIRTGRRAEVDSVFARYPAHPAGLSLDLLSALRLAAAARFAPVTARQALAHPDSSLTATLRRTFRFALSLDIPQAEAMLGAGFARGGTDAATRASGLEAEGLSALVLGRVREGLALVDSAALLLDTPGLLEAAEWRVIPDALGVFVLAPAERERGREVLRRLAARRGAIGARAAWALALDQMARGNFAAAGDWGAALTSRPLPDTTRRLTGLLAAVALGRQGRYDSALALSAPLLLEDEAPLVPDPFARAVLHLERGRWALATGDSVTAGREWLWSENADLQGWPDGPAQAAEVDWVFGSYARVLQAGLSGTRRGTPPCARLARIDTLLSSADRDRFPMADTADLLVRACVP